MKISKLMALFVFGALAANSVSAKELAEGTVEVSGDSSLSLSSTKTDYSGGGSEDTDIRTLSLTALYYVAPNIGVGIMWNNLSAENDDGFNTSKYTQNVLGPIAGYNASIDATSSFQLYAGFVLIGSFEDKTNGFTNYKGDTKGHILGVNYKKFLTDSVSFNAGFNLLSLTNDVDGGGSSDDDTRNLEFGLSVYF